MADSKFTVVHTDAKTQARIGKLRTAHGIVNTPIFMPVGTRGTVKTCTPRDLVEIGAEIILGNTYHLYLRPGHRIIEQASGLHKFMAWKETYPHRQRWVSGFQPRTTSHYYGRGRRIPF